MIVVSGLMRSGTSPVARMLHQMGVEMGTMMRFPSTNSHAHVEWEDASLAESLIAHLSGKVEIGIYDLLSGYIMERTGNWGVKTPFLLPYISQWKNLAASRGMPMTLILTERAESETWKSLERQIAHLPDEQRGATQELCRNIQQTLIYHYSMAPPAALVVHFDDLRRDPRSVARQLAEVADVKVDLDVATRGIWGGN